MTPERWQEVKERLAVALELDGADRDAYLSRACAGNPTLRADIDRLLTVETSAHTGFRTEPSEAGDSSESSGPAPASRLGRRLGAYEIVAPIGVGGMGEVYRAVRADDEYRSQVAIKVVRSDEGSDSVISRFKNERQILAGLDHPNIARLLDGGTTDDGVPYFVMELVEGLPIDEYCEARASSLVERLHLFLQVCSAVQYAHQRLIVHRDIKPSNIIVTAAGVPKLLDFGIAKLVTEDQGAALPVVTLPTHRWLSPMYASPEQVKGEPITTASDVYSLGVVLYELLTGHHPYRLATGLPHEVSEAICESEPLRPSAVTTRAEAPSRRLAGDLDNIVLMAIRKEPARRYASVEQFAEDIRRSLANLPVIARRDTVRYRLAKFAVRHTGAVAATAALIASLGAGLVATVHEARVARQEARLAESRFNDIRRLANSLIFEIHDSIRSLPGATQARQLIARRAQEYLDGLAAVSRSDPNLLRELAAAYGRLGDVQGNPLVSNVGDTAKAVESFRKSSELRQAALALDPGNVQIRREVAESYMALALSLGRAGAKADATRYNRDAIQLLEPLAASRPGDAGLQYALAKALERSAGDLVTDNKFDDGRRLYEQSLEMYRRLSGLDPKNALYDSEVSFGHKHIAAILSMQEQFRPALEHERAALRIEELRLTSHPDDYATRYSVTFTYSDMGYILGGLGDLDSALLYYRKALDIRSAQAAADPQDNRARQGLGNTYFYISGLLGEKHDYRAAVDAATESLEIREALGRGDPANQAIGLQIAESKERLGHLYESMAFRPGLAFGRQRALCAEADRWLSASLDVLVDRLNRGELVGGARSLPDDVRRALAKCRSVSSNQ